MIVDPAAIFARQRTVDFADKLQGRFIGHVGVPLLVFISKSVANYSPVAMNHIQACRILVRTGLIAALLFSGEFVQRAEADTMYKCQDTKGTISYSMTQCDPGTTELWSKPASKAGPRTTQPVAQPSEPKAAEYGEGLNILGVDSKVTEKNNSWWRYSWRLTVYNNSDRPRAFRAKLKFLDSEGFVLDDRSTASLSLEANETRTFTDYVLVRMPGAASVRETRAQLLAR